LRELPGRLTPVAAGPVEEIDRLGVLSARSLAEQRPAERVAGVDAAVTALPVATSQRPASRFSSAACSHADALAR